MFLLSNIHDRDYAKIYTNIENVLFDISDSQLKNTKNAAWYAIEPGDLVCVVRGTRNISTFCRVEGKRRTDISDGEGGFHHVIVGRVVGKLKDDMDMTYVLNKFSVSSPYLPNNKFSIGFNMTDLGNALSELQIRTKDGEVALGTLEPSVRE